MPTYKYRAKNVQGKTVTGQLAAVSEVALSARLDKMGLTPLSIAIDKPGAGGGLLQSLFKPNKKVSADAMVGFTRQFATIVKAGVPIVTGLHVLSEQTESENLKDVLNKVRRDIEGGSSLSQALDKYPVVFSELYVNSVVAGEAGGVLDQVLLRLAELMERDAETRAAVSGALQYPMMTGIAIVIAVGVMVVFVVPKFANIYGRMGVSLPLPTQILIGTNYVVVHYWLLMLVVAIVGTALLRRYIDTPRGRLQWDGMKLQLPIFGQLFLKVAMARFAMMLQTLNSSGLPILRSLEIVSTTVGNAVVGREIELLKRSVADGRGISGSILASKVFPPMVGHMVSIGETTGALDDMLSSVTAYYDLEIRSLVKRLTTMIEPIMTAITGGIVLLMALAIFLPMWGMMKVMQQ